MIDWIKGLLGLDHNPFGLYYVYELKDPRYSPPRVFYVGKGRDARRYDHEEETRAILGVGKGRDRAGKRAFGSRAMLLKHKHKVIIEIWDAGLEVMHGVVFRSDNPCAALRVEAEYINRVGLERLTNERFGDGKKALERCEKKERAA